MPNNLTTQPQFKTQDDSTEGPNFASVDSIELIVCIFISPAIEACPGRHVLRFYAMFNGNRETMTDRYEHFEEIVIGPQMADFTKFRWLNEPTIWKLEEGALFVTTDKKTDFWRGTWYGFQRHTGHVFGCDIAGDFTFQVCIEAEFTTLYDQAGVMVLVDEEHWVKAGIEYNDGQPMIGSVLTNQDSDWATGIYPGNPRKFWMRITKTKSCLRTQYSCDGATWPLLRLCPVPEITSSNGTDYKCFVGVMCCTPERSGLTVTFHDVTLTGAVGKDLHDLS